MAEATSPEWQGKVSVGLKGATAEQVWPFLEDFCGSDNLHPDADICRTVEGVAGKPGLVRYCACSERVSPSGEALLSYQIIDSNMGFKYYVGAMKVLAVVEDQGSWFKNVIEWSFEADPIEGWTLQSFEGYIKGKECLRFMAEKIEYRVLS